LFFFLMEEGMKREGEDVKYTSWKVGIEIMGKSD